MLVTSSRLARLRLRRSVVVLVLVAMFGYGHIGDARDVDAAEIRKYGPTTGPTWGETDANIPLRTRGYIDDVCLEWLRAFCGYLNEPGIARKEMSAQVMAMWTLAALRIPPDVPTPFDEGYRHIDWEVGANSDTERALRGVEPPGEIDDPCESGSPLGSARWRIDIVVDQRSIIEVKDWQQGLAQDDVDEQLQCYGDRGAALSPTVRFGLNNTLQLIDWAMPFSVVIPPAGPIIYCAFAGPKNGHVYFAPLGDMTIPEDKADKCGGEAGAFPHTRRPTASDHSAQRRLWHISRGQGSHLSVGSPLLPADLED